MARDPITLDQARIRACRSGRRLDLPRFEADPRALAGDLDRTMSAADSRLDALAALPSASLDFENTLGMLDELGHRIGRLAGILHLLQEASPDPELRDRARDLVKKFQDWSVGIEYREDVYRSIRAYADGRPVLEGERRRLLEHVLRGYRRAGLPLPPKERDEVEALRKELARVGTDFDANITGATAVLEWSREELEGLPEEFLAQDSLRNAEGRYELHAEIAWHFLVVMENARRESTRRRMTEARHSLASGTNIGLIGEMLRLRSEIARRLGYRSWADYRTEIRMAADGASAEGFLRDLRRGLAEKFSAEREVWRKMKARDTSDPDAVLQLWDWRYYAGREVREHYRVDKEALRAYFPYERTRDGLFDLAGSLFGLDIVPLAGARTWAEGVESHLVSDAATGAPLGTLHLDMFPREGKYRHFAQFGLIGGRRHADGTYQCPCVALICNFPPPTPERPSLLSHDEVQTLFHEFGHALHSLLTRAVFSEFSGTSVPRDYVEVPSQLLERWAWDQDTLDGFAAHWRDPEERIPPGTIDRLRRARLASIGAHYRRQAAFGLLDLAFHGFAVPSDPLALSERILAETFLPSPENTAFVAGFGHLNGYDAGYYGYAWSDAIAADLDTPFHDTPGSRRNAALGRRLRDEIYAPGNSVDPARAIERFLGRPRSLAPFLESLGISASPGSDSAP